ncbi:MAG: hypothetical protein SWH54_15825 [Thermodesulfobacteriota bacterium]|nr:hypothetical protein [Thermodesulfobacteriota bacterium]
MFFYSHHIAAGNARFFGFVVRQRYLPVLIPSKQGSGKTLGVIKDIRCGGRGVHIWV